MICDALATIAAVGAASAQVSLTGSTTAYWTNVSDGTAGGVVLGGAVINFAASEDMGNGWSTGIKMELDMDNGRDAKAYHGDRSISLTGPMATFTMVNTRSGGTQAAAFVAPTNLWNDFWGAGAGVLSRQNIDVLVLSFPVNKEITVSAKYLEGQCNTSVGTSVATNSWTASTTAASPAKDPSTYTDAEKAWAAAYGACAQQDGAIQPGAATYAASLKYASGPLLIMADAVSTNPTDTTRANLAAAGVASPRTQSYNATATYDAGFAKFGLGYDSPRRAKPEGTDQGAVLMSFAAPLGATTVGMNYGLRDGQTIIQAAAAYSMSKRTTLNASWGQYTTKQNWGAAAPLVESALSLSHSF